jgi:hypothetical protein
MNVAAYARGSLRQVGPRGPARGDPARQLRWPPNSPKRDSASLGARGSRWRREARASDRISGQLPNRISVVTLVEGDGPRWVYQVLVEGKVAWQRRLRYDARRGAMRHVRARREQARVAVRLATGEGVL